MWRPAKCKIWAGLASALMLLGPCSFADGQTLQAIKDRGSLVCGVSQGIPGFSIESKPGAWSGFDVDFCRALAAAIFDDPNKVTFVPLSTGERFPALEAAKIDVLSRNSSWTISRELGSGLLFATTTYFDGQGFMLRADKKIESALELNGSRVCVQPDTTTALNVADYFAENGMSFNTVVKNAADAAKAYESGDCDVLTSDVSQLHAERTKLTRPGDHVILADIISKEPLGPVVRDKDPQWAKIVKWTHFAMVDAEELGVSTSTLQQGLASKKPDVRRLLGLEGNYGEAAGLDRQWVVRILRRVGNYAEVFERNLGTQTSLGIPRGVNQLWSKGGILYAPPIR
jgi:general L-amino acid transport system substrate-binding protein